MTSSAILVTGSAGYIGSHMVKLLRSQGRQTLHGAGFLGRRHRYAADNTQAI